MNITDLKTLSSCNPLLTQLMTRPWLELPQRLRGLLKTQLHVQWKQYTDCHLPSAYWKLEDHIRDLDMDLQGSRGCSIHCPGHSPVSVRHHMENFILLTVCADDFNLLIHEPFIINKLWYLLFIVLSILSLLATIETILILFSNLVTRTSQGLMHSSDQEIKHNC